MMPRLQGSSGGGGRRRTTCSRTTGTFLSACFVSACEALQNCGDFQCGDGHQCCPPSVTLNGSSSSSSSAVRCCKLPIHIFFDNVGWFTRKLSGILILLLLFAMGYFIQRIICPRPRRQPNHQSSSDHRSAGEEPSSISIFHHHGHNASTSASQDSLLDRYPDYSLGDFVTASPSLPAYDEVKYLPTYEESMQEMMHRDRSDDNLLADNERGGEGSRAGDQRRDVLEVQHSPAARTSRNSV
ncbi:putative membrane protein C3orf80 homolog [Sebastes fasciatus]|uniref:putative membrane protein C3orf80 homolog n=1 Tax=Sebastes fasciatus TaxID=394691 RepID=UPI003D9E74BD